MRGGTIAEKKDVFNQVSILRHRNLLQLELSSVEHKFIRCELKFKELISKSKLITEGVNRPQTVKSIFEGVPPP